jgi:hypothetical protein
MITERWLTHEDYSTIELSLLLDSHHKTTTPNFFYKDGTACKVYEDESGPIMFVRGTKALRIDIQFVDNNDFERNKEAITEGFDGFVQQCKDNGFTELVFYSDSPLLKRFLKRKEFGFVEVSGEMRKLI